MSLGKNFLGRFNRKTIKPREVKIDILTVLDSLDPVLRTLGYIKPGEQVMAADVIDYKTSELTINIYAKKEAQSRTRKD